MSAHMRWQNRMDTFAQMLARAEEGVSEFLERAGDAGCDDTEDEVPA